MSKRKRSSTFSEQEIGEVLFTIPRKVKDVVKKWMDEDRRCIRCCQVYREIDNIGRWQCTQHARDWNGDKCGKFRGRNQWDCCGSDTIYANSWGYPGCVTADHTVEILPYQRGEDDKLIPVLLKKLISPLPQAMLTETTDMHETRRQPLEARWMCISRFDRIEDDIRRDFGVSSKYNDIRRGMAIPYRFTSRYGIDTQ